MRAGPPRYTTEFKTDALELLKQTDRSLAQVAEDIGVNHWTLRYWYRQDQMGRRTKKPPAKGAVRPPAAETAEQRASRLERENERLRKENESLKMDREILKKAAAFFAKESE